MTSIAIFSLSPHSPNRIELDSDKRGMASLLGKESARSLTPPRWAGELARVFSSHRVEDLTYPQIQNASTDPLPFQLTKPFPMEPSGNGTRIQDGRTKSRT